jgi:hypothetical protein
VSGQLHAQAAKPPGKKQKYPLNRRLHTVFWRENLKKKRPLEDLA